MKKRLVYLTFGVILFGCDSSDLEFVSLGVVDLQSSSLPLRLDPENEVVITTNQWGFHLIDQEPFDEESMAYWQFDPTEQRNINGKVVEKLTGERYAIELHMEIR